VWNKAFTSTSTSIGGTGPETGDTTRDEFDGDGKKIKFELSAKPLRRQLALETPPGRTRDEGTDFRVDYATGIVAFESPPEKGRKIVVRYYSGKGSGEVQALRLRLVYSLDVWGSEPSEMGSFANQVASAILLSRESLAERGIQLRLVRGRDLPLENGESAMYCKSLECVAEADMQVRTPYTRMEKILVKKPEKQA